jgi:hypothetical protein
MASLFNISMEFKALYDLANEVEADDVEAMQELFSGIELQLSDKLDNASLVITELDANAATLKARAKALTERARVYENNAKRLRDMMLSALKASGQEKLKTLEHNFYIKRSESVMVGDIEELPREFRRIKHEPDKTAIKEALKSGATVDGCSLTESEALVIKG